MGEQPVPVEDEVERALASMGAGFLTGSDQIAAGVASLEEHLAEAPVEEHESLRATVAQIVATQERLKARMDRLPAPSWDRFKVMVGVLKAQQVILDQLGLLVKEHVLPRQLQNLTITPFPPAPDSATPPSAHELAPHELARHELPPHEMTPRGLATRNLVARHGLARHRPAQRGAASPPDDEEDGPRSLLAWARERTAGFRGLAAMVVAGVVLSQFPRDLKLQDLTAKLVAIVGVEAVPASGSDPTPAAEASPAPPRAAARPAESMSPAPSEVAVVRDRPRPSAVPFERHPAAPALAPRDTLEATDLEPPASVQPRETRVAAPAVASKPRVQAANVPDEQFVPVVFTHKDHATVMRALADLKQQYPNLLIGRKGEVQPVDLGKKGIWHRLVFLPAGPRPQATRLCDQLMAEGYDRCWVKAY